MTPLFSRVRAGVRLLIMYFVGRVRQVTPYARLAMHKPSVMRYIVLSARHAQIALVAAILFLSLLAGPLVKTTISTVFPMTTEKKVLGFIKTKKRHPLARKTGQILLTGLWAGSTGTVALLFWLYIPVGLGRAAALSRRREEEADSSIEDDPTRGCALYLKALSLTVDPEDEERLQAKLLEANGKVRELYDLPEGDMDAGEGTILDQVSNPIKAKTGSTPSQSTDYFGADDRYRIDAELGRGAMGVVYKAQDTVLDRTVALKELSGQLTHDEEYVARFRREAKALARLTHPSIVQVFDLIEHGAKFWMVLEFVDGGDLSDYLKKEGRLSPGETAALIAHVAEGLDFAHKQGIVHRDLKPSNILLTPDGKPKISDFGIARLGQSSALTQEGTVMGSPAYMSPEQATGGTIDERTDIYALGITCYELITGEVPFQGDTASVLAQHVIQPPPPPSGSVPDVPPGLESVILEMLEKKPEDRIGTMAEVAQRLGEFAPSPQTANQAI
jgi:tRNA A-37 threonylcarbamoyl transferase component Bud32